MSDKELVHSVRGKCIVYTIVTEGDALHDRYYWVGASQDGEVRMLSQGGVRGEDEQAKFLQKHPPLYVDHVAICSTPEAMYTHEVLQVNLLMSRLGNTSQVRGGRHNAAGELKYPPRGWPRDVREPPKSPASSSETDLSTSVVECPKIVGPDPRPGLACYYP